MLRVEAVRDAVARAEAHASAIGGSAVTLQAVREAGLRPVPAAGTDRSLPLERGTARTLRVSRSGARAVIGD